MPSACIMDLSAERQRPSPPADDFPELWREYAARNAPAATVVMLAFRHHHRMVYSVAHRILGSVSDAQDITQTVFEILHRTLAQVREPHSVAQYLRRCAVREALEVQRRRGWWRDKGEGAVVMREKTGHRDDEAYIVAAVHQLLAVLDPEERTAVVLRMVEHHAHEEAAELMGVSLSTLRRRLQSAHEKLVAAASDPKQKQLADAVREAT